MEQASVFGAFWLAGRAGNPPEFINLTDIFVHDYAVQATGTKDLHSD